MSSTIILARQAFIEALRTHGEFDYSDEAAERFWFASRIYDQLTQASPDPDGIDHLLMLDAPMAFGEFKEAKLVDAKDLENDPPADLTLADLTLAHIRLVRDVAKLAEMIEQGLRP